MAKRDRMYIDANDREIIKKIVEDGAFNFKDATNKDIFLFAMAVGIDANIEPEDYPIRTKEAFFLMKDLNDEDYALINACAISYFNSIDILNNEKEIYEYVESCAHIGLKLILDEIRQSSFSFTKQYHLKLNEKYNENVSNV